MVSWRTVKERCGNLLLTFTLPLRLWPPSLSFLVQYWSLVSPWSEISDSIISSRLNCWWTVALFTERAEASAAHQNKTSRLNFNYCSHRALLALCYWSTHEGVVSRTAIGSFCCQSKIVLRWRMYELSPSIRAQRWWSFQRNAVREGTTTT